jgi:hypothetical protein
MAWKGKKKLTVDNMDDAVVAIRRLGIKERSSETDGLGT